MVKKRVPDWLNNSLWSSPPSSDDHHDPRSSAAATPTTTTFADEDLDRSAVDPPILAPSPPTPPTREDPPQPHRIEDSRVNDVVSNDHNATSSPPPSTDDISRQAQLLSEVYFLLFLSCQNQLLIAQLVISPPPLYSLVIKKGDRYKGAAENCMSGYT